MNFAREKRQIEKLTKEGLGKFASNDLEAALKAFERVLMLDGDHAVANTLGAASLLNLGRVDEAETLARTAVRLTPQLALAHYYLGVILIAKLENDEAESEIWEAVALEPYNAEMRVALGRLLFIRQRDDDAAEQLRQAVNLSAKNAEAHFLLGLCLMRAGQFREARVQLEETLRLQPENDSALTFDGLLCMASADDLLTTPPKLAGYKHGAELLRRAIEINPSNELAAEYLRVAEETIERISRPTEISKPETWYQSLLKLLSVWAGLAATAIGMFAVIAWLDESFGFEGFLYGTLFVSVGYLLAFCLMLYLRRDFSALPPSVVGLVERISKQSVSPIEPRAEG
jgi:Flp pilus assembly protein TadD